MNLGEVFDPEAEEVAQKAASILMQGLDADVIVITVVKDGRVGSVAAIDVADRERQFIAHAALQEYYIRIGRSVADAVG